MECRWKVPIKKVGSEVKTELTICNFPAWERKREVLTNLLSHLVTSGRKSSILGLVSPRGSPRYVNGRLPIEHPKVAARCLVLSSVRLIGTNMDLAKLTLSPVEAAKVLSSAFRMRSYLPHPSMMIRVSLAY